MEKRAERMIKNETWYVKELVAKVKNDEIYKPKYQRKRKWDEVQKKENVPSEDKYIEFLYDSHHSVHAITFGQDREKLSNIDGNNRINAICHFLTEPFVLFPDKLIPLKKIISEKKDAVVACKVEDIFKQITYDELMNFKYNKFFITKGHGELYKEHLKDLFDDIESTLDELVQQMKINNKDRFDSDVKININIFSGYTTEELSDVFSKINKYNSGLSEQEALASRLFNITDFSIHNAVVELEIKRILKAYYKDNTNGEILSCYEYQEQDTMNAYDFMVGFQNYANDKCKLILKTDNDGVSLFFKIFKTIYKSLDHTFTTENINDFIDYMLTTIHILKKLEKKMLMENLKGPIFDAANKKIKSLKKNNLYLILVSIIGYLKKGTSETEIIKSIEKSILYHFFVNSVSDKDKRNQYKFHDGILYEAGGAFIDNKAKEYLKTPESISSKISLDIMYSLLKTLLDEHTDNKTYMVRENGKDKYDKRRSRGLHEKVLIYYYYYCKVPTKYLSNTFWIEHMFPFSCSWENEIDIDRLGNIIPIIDTLNSNRGNKHISIYKRLDKEKFLSFIDMIPSLEIYDGTVTHHNTKPHIYDSEAFNLFCSENEEQLIQCFLEKIF
jgi:hypothetical protein